MSEDGLEKENKPVTQYTRRNFIKKVGALLVAPWLLATCDAETNIVTPVSNVKTDNSPKPLNTAEPTHIIPTDTVEPSPIIPKRTATPIEKLATSEPTKGWEVPGKEERKALLADPNTFTEPLGPSGRKIITPQFDNRQYERLDPKYLPYLKTCNYQGLSCSEAVMASILKLFTYLKTGDVPDITVADIINYLMDKNYQGYHFIWPNDISMGDDPFKWALEALKLFGKETNLYTVTQLTPDWGLGVSHIVNKDDWDGLLRILQKDGAFGIARVLKYGTPPGTRGHFIGLSVNEHDETVIIDPIGSYKNGDARVIALVGYVEPVAPNMESEGQPGFLWMAEVTPTF